MVVVETAKRAAYLGIAKMTGRVKGGDSARERLSDSEMSSLPRNFFSKTDQPASDTRDRSLLCALCGLDVQLYASSEIKAQLDGCIMRVSTLIIDILNIRDSLSLKNTIKLTWQY